MTTVPETVAQTKNSPGLADKVLGWPGKAVASSMRPKARAWLRRKAVAAWMNVLIAVTVGVTAATAGLLAQKHWPYPQTWGVSALKFFALWCLSFLPGWLYVRFIGMRAKALWNEYVLNLHRLGWDRPQSLPEPPPTSEFHDRWKQARHPQLDGGTIYQQKFEAYYGRDVTRAAIKDRQSSTPDETQTDHSGHDEEYRVSGESLFPVFLATAVLAVGWSAVLWDTRFVSAPDGVWDVLKYGFIGAYAFVTGMLIRRFYQSDLRPSAYASAVLRIILVLLIVAVLHQVIGSTAAIANHAELAVAFVIGFFPLVGIQFLQRTTSKVLHLVVPPISSEYPLDQLDGLNLWYDARLAEEGVEDMQNLTTMNLVDVILHTRVPPGRLVDWTDQAFPVDSPGQDRPERVGGAAARAEQAAAKAGRRGGHPSTAMRGARSSGAAQPTPGRHPDRHGLAQGLLEGGTAAVRLPAGAGLRPPARRSALASPRESAAAARRCAWI